MQKNIFPTITECYELMDKYKMLPNIKKHSIQVMKISLALTENLISSITFNKGVIIAAALLHDITKTKSLETNEDHDITGGKLLTEIGYPEIGNIVSEHVTIENFDPNGPLDEKEIIYYADKRVMHDQIVSTEERIDDLLKRYGHDNKKYNTIIQTKQFIDQIEKKINKYLIKNIEEIMLKIND
jgi:uncharacterized protein